jgi:hypothetical protein
MEKKNYKTKEEVLIDLIKAQDELQNEKESTDKIFIQKSKMKNIIELDHQYKNFNKK